MSSKHCLYIFIISLTIVAIVQSQDALQDVFGSADAYDYAGSQQAAVVTPASGASKDPDYWDATNEFTPSATDYDKFDWTLTKRVASISNENFLLSPLGLKLALAILAEAATAGTLAELNSVLGFDLDRNKVRRKFSTLLDSLQTSVASQYVLDLGSRVYLDSNIEPRQRYTAVAEQFYRTQVKSVDFKNPPTVSKEINSWVSNLTHGKITNLVDEDDVMGSVMLLLNTLYFKGSWRHQFPPNETKAAPFFVTPTLKKDTQFMRVKDKFYYTESPKFDAKILRMPYLGKKFSMYIVVPNSLTGLPRVLNSVNEIHSELYNLREHPVEVTLPKFNFEYTSLLDNILKDLGIRQAFEDSASFPGIARGQSLQQRIRVSKVLQRSGIEVNELGSVAYSATEISLGNRYGDDETVYHEVIANKPFLFFIEDEPMRQLLFTGRVTDPSLPDGAFKLT